MLGVMLQAGLFDFSNLLNQLEVLGFFRYILPAMLIFAVSFAILTKVDVFAKNKGASVIVAFAIAFLALQFDVVPAFFQNIFPKFGVGLAFLLIAMILMGAFLPADEKYKWVFFGIGGAIFALVSILTFSDLQFAGNAWWNQYGSLVIVGIVAIVIMILVVVTSRHDGGGSAKP